MDVQCYTRLRPHREIRAVYDEHSVRVYQAMPREIAVPAIDAQEFVSPFRVSGITSWIKPSFLWTMARTNWGSYCRMGKGGSREHEGNTIILGIDVAKTFFDSLLSAVHVTHFAERGDQTREEWRKTLRAAEVVVQWDPEKDLAGHRKPYRAIQIGLRRGMLREYAQGSIVRIEDQADVIEAVWSAADRATKIELLPDERPYPVSEHAERQLHIKILGHT